MPPWSSLRASRPDSDCLFASSKRPDEVHEVQEVHDDDVDDDDVDDDDDDEDDEDDDDDDDEDEDGGGGNGDGDDGKNDTDDNDDDDDDHDVHGCSSIFYFDQIGFLTSRSEGGTTLWKFNTAIQRNLIDLYLVTRFDSPGVFITTVTGLLCGEGQLHPQVTPHQESAKTPRSLSLHLCGTQATSYIASQYCSTKWTCKVHGFGFGSWAVSCDQILCRIKKEFASW